MGSRPRPITHSLTPPLGGAQRHAETAPRNGSPLVPDKAHAGCANSVGTDGYTYSREPRCETRAQTCTECCRIENRYRHHSEQFENWDDSSPPHGQNAQRRKGRPLQQTETRSRTVRQHVIIKSIHSLGRAFHWEHNAVFSNEHPPCRGQAIATRNCWRRHESVYAKGSANIWVRPHVHRAKHN